LRLLTRIFQKLRAQEEVNVGQLILDYIYEHEQSKGQQVFLTQPLGGGRIANYTWAETMDQARRMAAYLASQGFEPGARIAILSKNTAHFLMAELAIWMAGFTTVAIFPTESAKTIQYVLEHSGASLLFVGKLDTFEQQAAAIPPHLLCVTLPLAPSQATAVYPSWEGVMATTAPVRGQPARRGDELMFIVYTSGSTGTPKGVMHSFERGTLASESLAKEVFATSLPKDGKIRVLSYLPLAHIFERAVIECVGFVLGGVHIFFAESLETFRDDLLRARPTHFISVPRLWLKFQQGILEKIPQRKLDLLLSLPIVRTWVKRKILKQLGLDQVVEAGTGSAPMPVPLVQWYRRLGLNLSEALGMTEDFVYSHSSRGRDAQPGYVGVPFPRVERRIAADGELQLRSPCLFVGYYKRPDLDAEAFTEDGFFKTGDTAEIGPGGRLRLTGRKKETFKTAKGKFVAPAPIEAIINESASVDFSIVTGVGQAAAYAIVVPAENLRPQLGQREVRESFDAEMTALLARVNASVADYEQLRMIVVTREPWTIENGCLTPTLKIKRSAIETRANVAVDAWFSKPGPVIWA
jgi:long-chain acyl-CoA synthetase